MVAIAFSDRVLKAGNKAGDREQVIQTLGQMGMDISLITPLTPDAFLFECVRVFQLMAKTVAAADAETKQVISFCDDNAATLAMVGHDGEDYLQRFLEARQLNPSLTAAEFLHGRPAKVERPRAHQSAVVCFSDAELFEQESTIRQFAQANGQTLRTHGHHVNDYLKSYGKALKDRPRLSAKDFLAGK